jgi:hypothetical protein
VEDITTEHDVWMLSRGPYLIRIALYSVVGPDYQVEVVKVSSAEIQIDSKNDARYYFNQFTDLARCVRKLNRAAGRLFTGES